MRDKVNEIKISYKEALNTSMMNTIKSSEDAAKFLHQNWDRDTIGLYESFKVVLLNNSNKVKGIYELSNGGITGTVVDVRILFAIVLKSLSTGILICHNHPSSKLAPSQADKNLTQKIKKAAAFFDVNVLDHLIITPNGDYYSFSDNGLL